MKRMESLLLVVRVKVLVIEDIMRNKCGDCDFWDDGYCKRYPPQLILWPNDNQHPIMYHPYESFPVRHAQDKSCGEFK